MVLSCSSRHRGVPLDLDHPHLSSLQIYQNPRQIFTNQTNPLHNPTLKFPSRSLYYPSSSNSWFLFLSLFILRTRLVLFLPRFLVSSSTFSRFFIHVISYFSSLFQVNADGYNEMDVNFASLSFVLACTWFVRA